MSDHTHSLSPSATDALHKSRLLNVEERPFKRITKRLLTPNSIITAPPTLPPTPPPDGHALDEAAAAYEAEKQDQLESQRQWREDALLDFAAFESSIVRIQFLLTSNERERERYAAEKVTIEETAQSVREKTAELRLQLEEAQTTLALRKEYDELAEKITSNRLLRPREDQHANLDKLHAEIAELERESRDYANTWAERREQFGKIIEEGMQLRRLIRDEKEEVERREGMMEGREDGDGDGDADGEEEEGDGDDEAVSQVPGRISGPGTPSQGENGSIAPSRASQTLDRDHSPAAAGGSGDNSRRGRLLGGGGHATPDGRSPLRHARGVHEDSPEMAAGRRDGEGRGVEERDEGEGMVKEDEEEGEAVVREEGEDTDMAEDGEVEGESESDLVGMPSGRATAETNGQTPQAEDQMDESQ